MTYLDLVNAVLVRLRENTIDEGLLDSNPYYRSIGAHVNDAKDRVEDAWKWTHLRGIDFITASYMNDNTDAWVELPDSADNHYIITDLYNQETGQMLSRTSDARMRQLYSAIGSPPTLSSEFRGVPREYVYSRVGGDIVGVPATPSTNRYLTIFPAPTKDTPLSVGRFKHQPALVKHDDVLLVPSLPVYTLATASASRERGEIGGTPTSELFAIADSHLSDAIANDSAIVDGELDWYSAGYGWTNTNVGTA